jgi:hypothetical protein
MLPNAGMRKKNGDIKHQNDIRLRKSWQRYKLSFEKTLYCLFNSVLGRLLGFDCDLNFVSLDFCGRASAEATRVLFTFSLIGVEHGYHGLDTDFIFNKITIRVQSVLSVFHPY